MDDVIVVGAGPAGAMAATLLAREGVRVRLFDRARFPRPKLCGDTLNPGALRVLADHLDVSPLLDRSLPLQGMVLTGPGGVRVTGAYGHGLTGRAILRRDFDDWLLRHAAAAGARVAEGVAIREPLVDRDGVVTGVRADANGSAATYHARLVIGADGRSSRLARALGLAAHPRRPRRWAIGGYFDGVRELTAMGEMHVRRGRYIGVAPIPGGLANACLVVPHGSGDAAMRQPGDLLIAALAADPELRPRFADARLIESPQVLGPMAVDASGCGAPGVLLAGDAAGFIDPMTGDGLRFALLGGMLAARVASGVLGGTIDAHAAHVRLAEARRRAFAAKWRFNRTVRALVTSPRAVSGAAMAASVLPSAFEAVIRYAGDCG